MDGQIGQKSKNAFSKADFLIKHGGVISNLLIQWTVETTHEYSKTKSKRFSTSSVQQMQYDFELGGDGNEGNAG